MEVGNKVKIICDNYYGQTGTIVRIGKNWADMTVVYVKIDSEPYAETPFYAAELNKV